MKLHQRTLRFTWPLIVMHYGCKINQKFDSLRVLLRTQVRVPCKDISSAFSGE